MQMPKTLLVSIIILAIGAVYPALHIKTDFNLEGFFPKDSRTISEYRDFAEEFGPDDNTIIFGFERSDLFSREVLSDLKAITDSANTLPHTAEVRSIWNAEQIVGAGASLRFKPYLTEQILQQGDLDSLKESILADPFVAGVLVSEDADLTAVIVEIEKDKNNYSVRQQILDDLDHILAPYQSKYEFLFSGIPYFRNTYVSLLNHEIIFFVGLSSVLIILLLWVLYRSISGIIIPMIIVWLTVLFTVAVVELTGGYFEILSSTIAPILLCVGIADSVHMISKYDDALRHNLPKKKAISETLQTLGSATFLTSITTAIGFGTLVTSNVIPMKRFGIYTAIGVMIAYVVTITLLPSVLDFFSIRNIMQKKKNRFFVWLEKILVRIDGINNKHYRAIVWFSIIVSAVIGVGTLNLTINSRVFDDLGRDTEVIQESEYLSKKLTPPFPMEFVIDTGRPDGIKDTTLIRKMAELESYLLRFDAIERVTSVNTILEELHKTLAPERARQRALPADPGLLAQYLLLLEVNDAEFLSSMVDFDYRKARVSARMYDKGSKYTNAIRDSVSIYLTDNFSEYDVDMTGTTILVADLTDNIVYSLSTSIMLAFVCISILMAFLFRNFRLVIISLIPNLLPLVMVAGIMGYLDVYIKPSTAVIFTIAFGIAVDDSIHYLARFRVEALRGASMSEALSISTQKTGKAIIITSLILITGFGVLGFSEFSSTMLMGMLVCLTILIALLADLLFLPSLFHWIKPSLNFRKEIDTPTAEDDQVEAYRKRELVELESG